MQEHSKKGIIWMISELCLFAAVIACIWVLLFRERNLVVGAMTLFFLVIFLLFFFYGKNLLYRLEEDGLSIESYPIFHLKIPYKEIYQIEESHSAVSSCALSIDRIAITFQAQKGNGRDEVLISPEHKQAFLKELKNRTRMAKI